MRKLILYFLLSLTVVSCSSEVGTVEKPVNNGTVPTIPLAQVVQTPTETRIFEQIPTIVLNSTPSPTIDPKSRNSPIHPRITKLCPSQARVSIKKLNIGSTNGLFLSDSSNLYWYDIKEDVKRSIPLQAKIPLLYVEDWFQTSPDQKWFAYFAASEKDQVNLKELWISSIDGQQTWKIDFEFSRFDRMHWYDQSSISVFSQRATKTSCPTPKFLVDPFTKSIEKYEPEFPESGRFACDSISGTHWLSPDFSKNVVFNRGWKLFEYPSGKTTDIFPWLPSTGITSPFDLYLQVNQESVNLLQPNSGDLFFSLKLPFEDITESVELKRIELDISNLGQRIAWWSDNGQQIIIDSSLDASNRLEEKRGLMMLDFEENVLYDYCISRKNGSTILSSPNQRFIVWANTDSRSSETETIVILDKVTGFYSEIPSNLYLIDWIVGVR